MKRTAQVIWKGNLKEGKGTLSSPSGILDKTNYSFRTRFEDEKGTNPEELLAAAHAGCFTMAVSAAFTRQGITATLLETEASVTLEAGTITGVHLVIKGSVPGITAEEFEIVTKGAEQNCIISKALGVPITSEGQLVA